MARNIFLRFGEAIEQQRWKGQSTRPLNTDDMIDFEVATQQRRAPRNRAQIETDIKRLGGGYRLGRLRRDHQWLRRQYVKMGLNPDDAKDLL